VISRLVDEGVAVTDAEIVEAMAFLFDRMKLVVEPSGAIALAAVMSGKVDVAGKRVGVIVSGGNLGVDRAVELFGHR
jgi:threonine dehydratase